MWSSIVQKVFFKPTAQVHWLNSKLKVMDENHEGFCGNHSGSRSLAKKIALQSYFWPTMVKDPERYAYECVPKIYSSASILSKELTFVSSPWSFIQLGMDIVRLLAQAPSQKKFIW